MDRYPVNPFRPAYLQMPPFSGRCSLGSLDVVLYSKALLSPSHVPPMYKAADSLLSQASDPHFMHVGSFDPPPAAKDRPLVLPGFFARPLFFFFILRNYKFPRMKPFQMKFDPLLQVGTSCWPFDFQDFPSHNFLSPPYRLRSTLSGFSSLSSLFFPSCFRPEKDRSRPRFRSSHHHFSHYLLTSKGPFSSIFFRIFVKRNAFPNFRLPRCPSSTVSLSLSSTFFRAAPPFSLF